MGCHPCQRTKVLSGVQHLLGTTRWFSVAFMCICGDAWSRVAWAGAVSLRAPFCGYTERTVHAQASASAHNDPIDQRNLNDAWGCAGEARYEVVELELRPEQVRACLPVSRHRLPHHALHIPARTEGLHIRAK